MRKKVLIVLPLIVLLAACSYFGTIQSKWDRLTPDEKARIILSDMQGQLSSLFDQGKAYVTANPQHQTIWKSKIVPAFDVANRSIATALQLGKGQGLTPNFIYSTVQPNINAVLTLLQQINMIKKEV